MATLLLLLIYVAFISLGLPDALLGAGWPVMQPELGVPVSAAGLLQLIISGGTIVSSMFAGQLLARFGTGKLTAFSVALTAIALFGFAAAPAFGWLILMAVPLGLGAGAVDAALNAYVANHYASRHMSWLHSFWGVGALGGPLLLSILFAEQLGWRLGYSSIAVFQVVLVIVLLLAIPLWSRVKVRRDVDQPSNESERPLSLSNALRIKGVGLAMVVFLFYCGLELTMGLWGASYLYQTRGLAAADAAYWVSIFYASITLGRFATGFGSYRFSNLTMIRAGSLVIAVGVLLMWLPLSLPFSLCGYVLIGLGCAPIFPCMLHETPARFGQASSQSIMGYQMAFAYIGATALPPLFGLVAGMTSISYLPYFLVVYGLSILFGSEALRRLVPPKTAGLVR